MSQAARFGRLLRDARELCGLTPQQVARDAHIPLGHVEALELGNLHAIPAGLYLRAEARAYAEAVGLEPALVLRELRRAHEQQEESGLPVEESVSPAAAATVYPSVRRPRRTSRGVAALAMGVAALLWEQAGTAPTLPPSPPEPAAAAPASAQGRMVSPAAPGGARAHAAVTTPSSPAAMRKSPPVLTVRTVPAGARVTVDGIGWGTTPVTIRHLPPGPKRIRVVKDRFRSEERVVDLSAESRRVEIQLMRARRR